MKSNLILSAVAAVLLPIGSTSLAYAQTVGVRDAANMFSEDARQRATVELERVHTSTGWPVVIETIESLGEKPVDTLALDKARSLQIRGVFLLLAKTEHKISIQANQSAVPPFDSAVRESLKKTMTSAFKDKKFDDGLMEGVAYLSRVAHEHPAKKATAPANRPANGAPATNSGRSILLTVLVIGGVVLLVLFVIGRMSGASRPGMGGMGAPGGGFMSSLFGSIGGVFLGNWLYNSFFGGSAHASEARPPNEFSNTDAPVNDSYESTSGGWDEPAGDGGGFDGGDFGGGDMGGGDGGGGDW
jgi:uncharacterized membrane protein YgcG